MKNFSTSRRRGFVLIEALVALLIIAFGVVAITQLQVLSLFGSSEAKARSEAMALSQVKLESLRNLVEKSKFTGDPMTSSESPVSEAGQYATYSMTWTVTAPTGGLEQRLLELNTSWTDSKGTAQSIVLHSVIAWDDPSLQASASSGMGGTLISPTGAAKRMEKTITGQSGVYTDPSSKKTYLLDNTGKVLIYLDPVNGEAQKFATITGKIFFDQNAGNNKIPNSTNVRVRLSSEGECIYNNAALSNATGGSNSYKYFSYTCYVGPGWYGNVGVLVDDSVNGSAADPTICIGDPGFHGGTSDGTLISAHPVESATRSYRGFKGTSGSYLSVGMQGESAYGLTTTGTTRTGPFDGRPRPSEYPSYYSGITAGSTNDYFEQNFLITSISGNNSCSAKMTGGVFTRNAGKYVCINPDNDSAADVCPAIWPGFESQVGTGGGSINYSVTVTTSGSGTVTSSPSGISCGSSCSASYPSGTTVTLTAVPGSGATFAGWTGCASSSGSTCTVTGYAAVTASFSGGTTSDSLTVTKAGTGSGTVTSSPAGIDCGPTCSSTSSNFTNGTSVTLTALAASGSTFSGWSGSGCTGTGVCTVSVAGSTTVFANFAPSGQVCSATISGSAIYGANKGSVTGSTGVSCTMGSGNVSNYSCTLSLPQGVLFTLTNTPKNSKDGPTYRQSITNNCGDVVNVNFDASMAVP